jgi:hypothetical protein
MGYDLHIVRTAEWFDAKQDPITKAEVDILVSSDPGISWSKNDYLDLRNPITEETTRIPGLIFGSDDDVFWLVGGEITCKNPSEAQQIKMVRLGEKLHARVVGDDGELYRIRRSFFGKEQIVVETASS